MKAHARSYSAKTVRLGLTLLCLSATLRVAAAQSAVSSNPTNRAPELKPAEALVPQSTFVMPTKPPEGRDPFHPHSMRPYGALALVLTNQAVVAIAPVEVHLNGFSGTPARPLAIINNRTFAPGEEGEVRAGSDRLRVRCLEIKSETVVVQIGGERRILRLRGAVY